MLCWSHCKSVEKAMQFLFSVGFFSEDIRLIMQKMLNMSSFLFVKFLFQVLSINSMHTDIVKPYILLWRESHALCK